MLKLAIPCLAAALLACDKDAPEQTPRHDSDPISWVDPFIATGGTGFGQGGAYPGAAAPFGLVKLSPDTNGGIFGRASFAHFGGYWYGDTHIEGFSHLHLHGVGAIDYGLLAFMPTLGMNTDKTTHAGYAVGFTHSNEAATPGYYGVTLADGIAVELTATPHAGVHRYRFPEGSDAVVLIDLGHALEGVDVTSAAVTVDTGARRVFGHLDSQGAFSRRYGGVRVWFEAAFSRAWSAQGVWTDNALAPGVFQAAVTGSPVSAGAYLHFSTEDTAPVEVRVGVSVVSAEGARVNLVREAEGRSFDALRLAAEDGWRSELGRISVEGGSPRQRRIFYTALYHAFQMPSLYSDADGKYRILDELGSGGPLYSDMSLWDTYRTLHPLVTLIAPSYAADFAASLTRFAVATGALPRWPMGIGDGRSMVGTPADIVLADTYLKGVTGFDVETAFAGMLSTATYGDPFTMRAALGTYLAVGYCPADEVRGSVSVSLENMYADFAIGRLAAALGHDGAASEFALRAGRFDSLWDASVGFFRAKNADGAWATTHFSPTEHSSDYIEGTAWQYLWFVPWNSDGLADLLGGKAAAAAKLEEFFRLSMETEPIAPGGVRLPDNYYWHGNEPSLHAAYLFALLGYPEKAPPIIRWILETKYADTPAGLDGNDDGGTLSAWYVWSAIGLYPLPAETRYIIGSPIFRETKISLENGNVFTIRAPKADDRHMYVRAATLNGKPLDRAWIEHAEIAAGGVLALEMSATP